MHLLLKFWKDIINNLKQRVTFQCRHTIRWQRYGTSWKTFAFSYQNFQPITHWKPFLMVSGVKMAGIGGRIMESFERSFWWCFHPYYFKNIAHIKGVKSFKNRIYVTSRGEFLKKLFCLAGEAKPAIVVTILAPNFDLEDFF